jgi:allophanate hydrolase
VTSSIDLSIAALRKRYVAGDLTPERLLEALWPALDAPDDHNVWITRLTREELLAHARRLEGKDPAALPLYGVPFAIKDNIDLAGVPTTAACPAFAYTPQASATVVQRLVDAGAIPLGKTNLDQFATGLVGARSPYGAGRNSFDAAYVSGGSSSGSAVSVALGLASFALGTDTAGSGRVPAAFNNLVGHKPTCGVFPNTGVVPACRTLDTISIFALTAQDAHAVLDAAAGPDPQDPFSRALQPYGHPIGERFRFGVPAAKDLQFFGNAHAQRCFAQAAARMQALGGTLVEIDLAPFLEAARLLYEGPWVAERYAAIREFFDAHADALFPVTREIIGNARRWLAADAYRALYRLRELQAATSPVWNDIDVLVTPTAGTIYRVDEVEADPIRLNAHLGYYTNFVNLLDLSATAVPAGFLPDGLPFGITLVAPAHRDVALLQLAARVQRDAVDGMGATGLPLAEGAPIDPQGSASGLVQVAVCGAHMDGLPLNPQLASRGARLVRRARTAALYRFYALPGGPPLRPGLVRAEGGAAIEVEVWALPALHFGSFVAGIPAPLGIGTVELDDGSRVQGFVCEAYAVQGAQDITALGGWRAYLDTLRR